MAERDPSGAPDAGAAQGIASEKRPYRSPVLTEYGSIEELVDSGAVLGVVATVLLVPSIVVL